MQFFTTAVTPLQTLGAGLAVCGVVNLLEGYGSDNTAANAHVAKVTQEFDWRPPPTI